MNQHSVSYSALRPNFWNPNVMAGRVYDAELESITEFGFIDPITVRDGRPGEIFDFLEIIDGEHRYKGFGELRVKWQRGELEAFHSSLLALFEMNEVPVVNLGQIPDAQAKKLTIVLNETRGKANAVDIAALLAAIGAETGGQGLSTSLPYSGPELEDMLKLAQHDWNAVANTAPVEGDEGAGEGDQIQEFETLTVTLSFAAHVVYLRAFEQVKSQLLAKGEVWPSEEPLRHGRVLEVLAARLLL